MITNQAANAERYLTSGIDRIFIDLERLGKPERQAASGGFISDHSVEDIPVVKKVTGKKPLLVRINPIHAETAVEIDRVIGYGADIIMLPMFRSWRELQFVIDHIDERCLFCPLVETISGCQTILSSNDEQLGLLDEIYFGLNDLHLELNLRFMFSALLDPLVLETVVRTSEASVKFGFGGLSTTGSLDPEDVITLHAKYGSSLVILSRGFRENYKDTGDNELRKKLSVMRDCWTTLTNDEVGLSVGFDKVVRKIGLIENDLL